jgi:hypothetical protein
MGLGKLVQRDMLMHEDSWLVCPCRNESHLISSSDLDPFGPLVCHAYTQPHSPYIGEASFLLLTFVGIKQLDVHESPGDKYQDLF